MTFLKLPDLLTHPLFVVSAKSCNETFFVKTNVTIVSVLYNTKHHT